MTGKTKLLACTSLMAALAFIVPAEAATKKAPMAKAPTNQELLERIEKLESDLAKQKEDSRSTKAKVVDLAAQAKDVQWSFDNTRPTIKSGDGRFSLSFRGRFQADYASFGQSEGIHKNSATPNLDLSSGSLVRRAYFGVEGKAFNDFWYEFRINLGGGNGSEGSDPQINMARIAYIGIPHFRVNVGVIEPVFGMGNNVSSGQLLFLERPEAANIASQSFGAGDGRKGVEMTFAKEGMFYGADNLIISAAYTGANTGKAAGTSCTATPTAAAPCTGNNFTAAAEGHGNGGDEQSQVLSHIAYRVYSDPNTNVQVGANYARFLNGESLPNGNGLLGSSANGFGNFGLSDRPEIRVDGTTLVSVNAATYGTLNSASLYGYEAQAQYKNFYVGGEYQKYEFDLGGAKGANSPHFSSWYVEASWVLTGEHKSYEATAMNNEVGAFTMPKVVKPFSFSGRSWGAWELVARYSTLNLNFDNKLTTAQGGFAGGRQTGVTGGINWYLNQNVRLMVDDTIINVDKYSAAGTVNNFSGQNLNVIAARAQFQF